MTDIPVNALIRLPRHTYDAEIGGPRLITVSRGLKQVEQPPDAVTRTAASVYLFEKPGDMGPQPWLVFAFSLTSQEAGNTRSCIEKDEQQPYHLEEVGEVKAGIIWSPTSKKGGRLSLVSIDLTKKFMDQADIPHYLLLPKRVPASIRITDCCQLWVSL